MTAFPITYSNISPSGRGPSVTGNIDVSTGEGAIGQAVSSLGNSIFDLGMKYDLKQANTELSEAQRKTEEEWNRTLLSLDGNLDPSTYPKVYEQFENTRKTFRPKNRRAAEGFDLWSNAQSPNWQFTINKAMKARVEDNWETERFNKLTDLKNNPTPEKLDGYNKFLLRGYKADEYDSEEAGTPLDKTKYTKYITDGKSAQLEGQITNLYRVGEYDAARKLTESSPMSPEDKESMINTINMAEARALKRSQVDIDKVRQEYWKQYINDTEEGDNAILNSLSDPNNTLPVEGDGGKNEWYNRINSRTSNKVQRTTSEKDRMKRNLDEQIKKTEDETKKIALQKIVDGKFGTEQEYKTWLDENKYDNQLELLETFRKYKEARIGRRIDPSDEFDPVTYQDMSVRITKNSKNIRDSEIRALVGKGINGGITTKQAESLIDLKKKYDGGDIIGNRLHSRYVGAITGLRTVKVFSLNKVENVKLAAETQSILDSWAIKNPEATEEEYEDFFNRLIDTSNLSGWYTFFTRKAEEQRTAIKENIEVMKNELENNQEADLSKLTDAELLKRITGE